jgi:hypothetical protein
MKFGRGDREGETDRPLSDDWCPRKRGKNEGQTQAVRNRDEPDGRLMRIGMRIGGSRESALSLEGE